MRRKKHEEHENHERWLVSYADFITLLFAFFVVMYATSSQNVEKEKEFEESMRSELKLSAVAVGHGKGTGGSDGKMDVIEDTIGDIKKQLNTSELEEQLEKLLEKGLSPEEIKEAIVKVSKDKQGLRLTLTASAFFPLGSAKLKATALPELHKIANVLAKSPKKIVVEGHTDDLPLTGTSSGIETNWELASLRATTVVRYLIKMQNIDPKRLSAVSYADQRPIAPNDSEENRAKNRRIEILVGE